MKKPLISVMIGVILGFIASRMLFLQWVTFIPWGIAGVLIGYLSENRKSAIINGAFYGFFLGFVFMIGQYTGTDPLISKIPVFVVMGVISGVCGLILSFTGHFIRRRVRTA